MLIHLLINELTKLSVYTHFTNMYLLFMARMIDFELGFLCFFSCLSAHLKALNTKFEFRPKVVEACLKANLLHAQVSISEYSVDWN